MVDAIRATGNKRASLTLSRDKSIVQVEAAPNSSRVDFAGVKWVFPGGYATPGDDRDQPQVNSRQGRNQDR